MQNQPRVIFLESQQGVESLFTRGLRTGAAAAGWETDVVFLGDSLGLSRSEKDVRNDLLTKHADVICFLMDAPLHLKNLWDAPSLAGVEKISLWYDDYFRSPKTLANPEVWTAWQNNHGVRVGIWDGYWRIKWKSLTGVEAFPIHLAADPRILSPKAAAWQPAWSNRAAFVGTIPSLKSLETAALAFPPPLRRLLEEVCGAMNESAWPIRPYDLFRSCHSFLSIKYRNAVDAMLADPETLAVWNHLLWRWGKRIARLRGLSAVAKAGPLAIMSGHSTESYANEEELRIALPPGTDMVFADTRSIPAQAWKSLFRTGKFQVQVTDPQSIEGGLPFRVFECAASGVPLLSDHRAALGAMFPEGSGLVAALTENTLREGAVRLFQSSPEELATMGALLNERYLAEHTWEMRWKQLVQTRAPRARTAVFPDGVRRKLGGTTTLTKQPA